MISGGKAMIKQPEHISTVQFTAQTVQLQPRRFLPAGPCSAGGTCSSLSNGVGCLGAVSYYTLMNIRDSHGGSPARDIIQPNKSSDKVLLVEQK